MKSSNAIILTAIDLEASAIRRLLPDCRVYTLGIGATRLLPQLNADAKVIVLAGLAGALDPSLSIGDVVVDDSNGLLPASIRYRRGLIASADKIVETPAEKAKLFHQSGALAVDMEGAIVREFAQRLKIPFIHVRAISDTAEETLDPHVLGFVDDVGKVRPMKLAAALLRRPNLIPYLNQLGKNSRLAAERLGVAVREIVEKIL